MLHKLYPILAQVTSLQPCKHPVLEFIASAMSLQMRNLLMTVVGFRRILFRVVFY